MVVASVGLACAALSCDRGDRRAAEEDALRKRAPVKTATLEQAMGANERAVPKLPSAQDRFLFAVRQGDLEEAKRWLDKGAELDGKDAVLVAAVRGKGDLELIEWLIQSGAPLDAADDAGRTPLSWAASQGALRLVERLLGLGANVHRVDRLGRTPMHYATFSDETDVVEALLRAGADVNVQDLLGTTPLMYACSKNSRDMVGALHDAGADSTLVDKLGRTAAERAHGQGNPCRRMIHRAPEITSNETTIVGE